jgi:hypothetical protein
MTPKERRHPIATILWFAVGLVAVFVAIILLALLFGLFTPSIALL